MTTTPFPDLVGHRLATHMRIYNRFKVLFPKDSEEKTIEYTKNWVREGIMNEPIGTRPRGWRNVKI